MIQETHKGPKIALCRRCGGRGYLIRTGETCPQCGGSGRVTVSGDVRTEIYPYCPRRLEDEKGGTGW